MIARALATLALAGLLAVGVHAAPAGPVIAAAAEAQVGVTVGYDPAYHRLAFPGGDVPPETGVCADVVVRALRKTGVDLQREVNADMKANFAAYPANWGLKKPDPNIDHRRVPNLMKFFERKGKALPEDAAFLPGDIVAWRLPGGLHHIGIVAPARAEDGKPVVIHNIGSGARREDVLRQWKIIGHYRW